MIQNPLGRTGLRVSPLAFGTLPMGPLQANLSAADGGRLIRHALAQGVTLLDTAEMYGTYPHLRAGLAGWREPVALATKTHAPTAELARAHVEGALQALGRERLEIVHVHGARLADPFTDRAEVFTELVRLKAEGKVGHVGLSTHYAGVVRRAADRPEVEVLHPLVNRRGMGILDGTAADMADAIAHAASAGKGVYGMKALAGGNLIAEARESLRWVLGLPGIASLAVGMLSEAEIGANVRLAAEGAADPEVWQTLESRRRRLAIMDRFCKGCGACAEACTNDALVAGNGQPPQVDEAACILCGYCAAVCPEFIIRVV